MTANFDLYELQRTVEKTMVDAGREQFFTTFNRLVEDGDMGSTSAGQSIIAHAVADVADELEKRMENALLGKACKGASAYKKLTCIDTMTIAYIALRKILGTRNQQLTSVARQIGAAIEDQWLVSSAADLQKGWIQTAYKRTMQRQFQKSYIRKTIRNIALEVNEQAERWTIDEHIQAGTLVVDAVVQRTGLFVVSKVRENSKSIVTVRPTERLLKIVEKLNDHLSLMNPVIGAIPLPPKPWESTMQGVWYFMSDFTKRLPTLIRTRDKMIPKVIDCDQESWKHIKAADIVGQTPFEVNKFTLDIVREIKERGMVVGKIPQGELNVRPPNPFPDKDKEDFTEEEQEQFNRWRGEAREIELLNRTITGRRLLFTRLLKAAETCVDWPQLHFGYSFDWRGRMYAMADAFSPQGTDVAKGLLRFKRGEQVMDQEAVDWIAIHGANCYGVDKETFPDRVKWVNDNSDRICKVAEDPWFDLWWTEADEPICFLAFCDEWNRWKKEGLGFYTHLPVQVDGSNNGLQHFSAMLRDPIGATATNLNSELNTKPSDIYRQVADRAVARLQQLAATGDELAEQWLRFGVTRSTTKRPVMIVPYAGTLRSCVAYIEEYINEMAEKGHPIEWTLSADRNKAAIYLGPIVWEAISDTVVAAREAMTYIKEVTRPIAKANKTISWRTPSGWLCQQRYKKEKSRQIKTYFEGTLKRATVYDEVDSIDTRKSGSAVSANFVHSMDASAMVLCILKCHEKGIKDFSMIHDSYGCHATRMGGPNGMAAILREEFYKMYADNDVLKQLRDTVLETLDEPVELPPLPARGSFDLSRVLDSPYFFA